MDAPSNSTGRRDPLAARLETPRQRPPEGSSAIRLFVLIVLAIITANLISVTIATAGWPLSTGTSLLIHSALTVALLFAGLYLFAIGPLAMRIRELEMRTRELELKKEELQRLKVEVEKQLQQRTSELAEATQKIES